MNIERFLLIIIFIYVIYLHSIINKNIEKFALSIDDKNEVINLIKPAIKEVYNTDMESVRQLAAMSKQLLEGGVKIPGNLIVTGTITSTGDISSASHSLSGLNTSITTTNTALGTTNTNLGTTNTNIASANTKISSLETITAKFSGYEFKPVCMRRTNSAYYRTWWDYDKECVVSGNINSGWNEGGFTAILPVKSKY